ncbi:patatin-like phospholipase family protein [Dyadobacter sp. CY323]|uniref:patatin-like phospholipase family protein n=1 Tax=Dyadobacter sp. CY323 TaxID=2907302 RepID=UPI001F24D1C1|nr:patatin-like phospholipase family protein [Dyadobacter sp. CY323]MCE6991864.1 patatin-like phospholipase family protein [Dyadobacter sp. CY323]
MDIVTDLTSQAVSYLTLLQDICKDQDIPYDNNSRNEYVISVRATIPEIEIRYVNIAAKTDAAASETEASKDLIKRRIKRMKEIIFYSNTVENVETRLVESFFDSGKRLLEWLDTNISAGSKALENRDDAPLLMTPDQWRRSFRVILYENPAERVTLVDILHYVPFQVILALGGGKEDAYNQRLFQIYAKGKDVALLDTEENTILKTWWEEPYLNEETWWQDTYTAKPKSEFINELLTNDQELLKWVEQDNPVSFETAFTKELIHIDRSRKERRKDPSGFVQKTISLLKSDGPNNKGDFDLMDHEDANIPESGTKDPLLLAQEMKLTGLAFSGGGIRSATFNLGVLQKLAENGILQHIDYLSTVSGGGYIGSWFLSWIKRSGSISKVTDRLDSKKSTDPMADEVRPLRWLRMYSNYLAPNASIMSTDSWTIGVTWIRNTLINQSILLLLLCTLLALIENVYLLWKYFAVTDLYNNWVLGIGSTLILASGSVLAGLGMHTFDQDVSPKSLLRYGRDNRFASFLVGWAFVTAFLVSAWLFFITGNEQTFPHKLKVFILPAIVGMGGILLIAYWGNYQKHKRFKKNWKVHISIVISSAIAIAAAFLLLSLVWKIIEGIHLADLPGFYRGVSSTQWIRQASEFADTKILVFVIGIPLVLEVISLCVVIRMFIMGIYFPDERREWWGRMGAIVHRMILLWVVITVCVFILPKVVKVINEQDLKTLAGMLGGWAAIVGAGVRMAFTSTSSGENKDKTGFSVKEVFIRAAPYLFMIGFLLVGSYTLDFFKRLDVWSIITGIFDSLTRGTESNTILKKAIDTIESLPQAELLGGILNMTVVGALTLLLSWRAGVNEFTLHHFYRNRLIRAYLGATRRRTDRIKTANNFTGFDNNDDIKMQDLSVDNNYYGPYPLINTALNATIVSELDRQDRKAESFLFTPLFCGFDFSATRSAAYSKDGVYNYGYRPTKDFAGGPTLGTAMAISGAAVNPNMGYHSSAATAFLLSVFNVKLGWWIGNPRTDCWKDPEPKLGIGYITYDLIGKSTVNSNYVSLSDGGHFDNMGIYELVRRRCSLIIVGDAEEDSGSLCEGLANAVRRCRIDFGVEIEIDTDDITEKDAKTLMGKTHVVEGTIRYPGTAKPGKLIYIKTALTGDEPADIREYQMQNPKFPQQPTSDQFFTEDQFESYRKLGYHSIL